MDIDVDDTDLQGVNNQLCDYMTVCPFCDQLQYIAEWIPIELRFVKPLCSPQMKDTTGVRDIITIIQTVSLK